MRPRPAPSAPRCSRAPATRLLAPAAEPLERRTLLASFTATSTTDLIADINAANATSAADTITLKAGVTFTLTAVNNTTADGPTGLPAITGRLAIVGNGRTIQRSTAAGTPAFRLFDVNAGASLTLTNLTLRNGRAAGHGPTSSTPRSSLPGVVFPPPPAIPPGRPRGGAVYSEGALTLDRVTLLDNAAAGSGARATITPSLVTSYMPGVGQGGGVYSSGVLTMTACTVRGNEALGGTGKSFNAYSGGGYSPASPAGGGFGGGVYVGGGSASISDTTFAANTARAGRGGPLGQTGGNGSGGGMYVAGGAATITGGAFDTNTAQGGDGGDGDEGFEIGGDGGVGSGGGLTVAGGTATVHTTAFTSNLARGGNGGNGDVFDHGGNGGNAGGGGFRISGGTATITAATFTANTARGGDGGYGYTGDDLHGGNGGNAYGGGIHAASGTLTLRDLRVTTNRATRGNAGAGRTTTPYPQPGKGYGGGIYIASSATVRLNAFTKSHVMQNIASTSSPNIRGTYTLI